jgi:hypothetical protein
MNPGSAKFSPLALVTFASVALAILAGTAHAQRMAVAPDRATGAAALKAQSIIKLPGSYILSRDIVVNKAGQDAVMITSPNVTLDLQGFSIIGSPNATTGNAINTTGQPNVVIKNGLITGFGGAAILAGDGTSISGLTVSDNGSGITCGIGCSVQNNLIQSNDGVGLTLSDTTSGYLGNVLQGNDHITSGGTSGQVTGGTSLGHNLCNGVVC